MSGFDASQYIKREAARPDAAPDPSQSVAAPPPDATRSLQQSSVEETAEKRRKPVKRARGVAGVATVAALDPGFPFFAELNRMFDYPIPPLFRGQRWRELCEDVRHFVATGRAGEALEKGWEPIELFGAHKRPWDIHRFPALGTASVVSLLRGRPVMHVTPARIEVRNDYGPSNQFYRAHHMTLRGNCDLMWDVFDPKYWPGGGSEPRILK